MKHTPRSAQVLLVAPTPAGGLAEHTFYQARALTRLGAKVEVLTCPAFLAGRDLPFPCRRDLADPAAEGGPRWLRRFRLGVRLLVNHVRVCWRVARRRPDLVLWDSYAEYLAPVWIWPHWLNARVLGIPYAANLHDPVRGYRVGPAWWHALSVRLAYLPLRFVLVHDRLPEPSPVPPGVSVVQVPVGVYDLPESPRSREEVRTLWKVGPGQRVFLAFGYLRDEKNLDLALRALRDVPGAFMVIAGAVPSGKDKPFNFYRELAAREGVAGRVVFHEGFVADADLAAYFAGADFVLLTYSATFHSQSGVLNLAARARKPVLASAAPSPMIESVTRFRLGVAVPPDSVAAIVEGMNRLLAEPPPPDSEAYEAAASWTANAAGILRTAGFAPAADAAVAASAQPVNA